MSDIALIAALDRNRAIGWRNTLPWSLPEDLKRFKALTMGHAIVMGRKTAESLPKALPGRRNLVLTRSGQIPHPGMEAVPSLDAARERSDGRLFVIGGGEIYTLALPEAQVMFLTHVDVALAHADAWFPAWTDTDWRVTQQNAYAADHRHAHAFTFTDYARHPS